MSTPHERRFRRICVFCGSQAGHDARYAEAARRFGHVLAESGVALVYGGGSVGLMGVLADAALERRGDVIGVIPQALARKELLHVGVSDMRVVPDMHARKALMAELSDGFVALPGGFGTFEELFEVITWAQLGIHRKPVGLLNVAGSFNPLSNMIEHAVETGFLRPEHRRLISVSSSVEELLPTLALQEPPTLPKWMRPDET